MTENIDPVAQEILDIFFVEDTNFAGAALDGMLSGITDNLKNLGYSFYNYLNTDYKDQLDMDTSRLIKLIDRGITSQDLRNICEVIAEEFLKKMPDDTLLELGSRVIGKVTGNTLAGQATVQYFLNKVGIDVVSRFGVGFAFSLEGYRARACYRSRYLKDNHPNIYWKLRSLGDLDLLYFLVEDKMSPFIHTLEIYKMDPERYNQIIDDIFFGNRN